MTRKRTAASTGRQLTDLMIAAPEVVAIRTSRMAAMSGPTCRRDQREMARMVMEKGAAAQESWLGVAAEIALANQKMFAATVGAFWVGPFPATGAGAPAALALRLGEISQDAFYGAMAAAISPLRKRAMANVRRLRKP
ncbi:hypothetical protein ACFQZQ_12915 [Lysobacter koreensis]|uniref:Phasin domain-containing protein n=1 Tax=Lysobacter koreensis TaxID=266122 RepID=A0ABW2YPB2_9GAMM